MDFSFFLKYNFKGEIVTGLVIIFIFIYVMICAFTSVCKCESKVR